MAYAPANNKPKGQKLIDHVLSDENTTFMLWQPENEFPEFFALAFNALKVTNTPFKQARTIKDQLLKNNFVGFDRIAGEWYKATPIIKENERVPSKANFYYDNGKIIERELSYSPNGSFYLIQGLAAPDISYARIIHNHTDLMYDCDIAIRQNIGATMTASFIVVNDDTERLSIEHAIQQRQAGNPVIIVNKTILDNFKSIQPSTPITFPQIYEFRQQVRDSLLNKLATLTANTQKRERVQSAEVNAGVSECEDYIYSFIDNVNEQCQSYGLKQRLINNTSLEELYEGEENNLDREVNNID